MKEKTTFVNNPIDTNIFNSEVPKLFTKDIKIAYSGRVHPEKGLDILVRAVNKLYSDNSNISLSIIGARDIAHGGGGNEYIKYLNTLADGWQINWIDPIYDSKELASALSKHDVFCYPSVADKGETFGVAPLEAMGLGLVTIVSSLACFRDFVEDGKNGIVFNHHDENPDKCLIKAFETILDNKNYFESLSSNAIETSKKFCVNNIAKNYIDLFESILSNNKKNK